MIKMLIVVLFLLDSTGVWSDEKAANSTAPKKQVLKPTMRAVDRDWKYFSEQSCDQINRFVGHSSKEQKLIIKRKKQCMNKYKAFLPQPISR